MNRNRLPLGGTLLVLLALAGATSLAAAATVTGRVVTTNGVGIPGIDLDVIDAVTGQVLPILDDDTDADGSFDFEVPDGRYRIRFEPAPSQPLVAREFTHWRLENHRQWTVEMEVGAFLSGTVRDPAGSPVAGCTLDFLDLDHQGSIYVTDDQTDLQGGFRVPVPRGVRIAVIVKPPAGTDLLAQALPTLDPLTVGTDLGDVILDRGYRVSGVVRSSGVGEARVNIDAFDAEGLPIPLAHDKTDATGAFEIILPPGRCRLVASPRVYRGMAPVSPGVFEVLADMTLGDLLVTTGATLTGTIHDDAAKGVGAATVSVRDLAGQGVDISGGTANAEGDYILVAPPGMVDVTAVAPHYLELDDATVANFDLTADASLNLELTPSLTPIRGLTLTLVQGTDHIEARWAVAEASRFLGFRISRVAAGGFAQPLHQGWISEANLPLGGRVRHAGEIADYLVPLPELESGDAVLLEALTRDGSIEVEGPRDIPVERVTRTTGRMFASPNPLSAGGRLRLETGSGVAAPVPGDVAVFDARGRRVARLPALNGHGDPARGTWEWTLSAPDLEALPSGIYFVRVEWGGREFHGRFLRLAR